MAQGESPELGFFDDRAGASLLSAPPPSGSPSSRMPPRPDPQALKNDDAFKSISETAAMLALPQHVLRFWESRFPQIKPIKLKGGRRYYRPQDIETLFTIKRLLYKEGYTIKGARRAIHQIRKPKDSMLPEPDAAPVRAPRRKSAPKDAPLFDGLKPPAEPAVSMSAPEARTPVLAAPVMSERAVHRAQELRRIHAELLKLRDLVQALPHMHIEA